MSKTKHPQNDYGTPPALEVIRHVTLDGVCYAPSIESVSFALDLACADLAAEVSIRIQPTFSSNSSFRDFDEMHDILIGFPECLDIEQIPRITVRSVDILEILNAAVTDRGRKLKDVRGRIISAIVGQSTRLIIERQVNELEFTVYIGEFSSQTLLPFSNKISQIFQGIRHRHGARDVARRAS